MPRGHIDPGDRDLRRRIRQRIGTLRLNRVARKTQERYVWALRYRPWGRFRTWGMLELPIRAPPMPATVACALSGLALQQQQLGLAAVLLAAFD